MPPLANAQFVATGRVNALEDGRLDVRFRLWDVRSGADVVARGFVVEPRDLRLAAHQIADTIQFRSTGVPGRSSWRKLSIDLADGRWRLTVSDSDGHNPGVALTSAKPLAMPVWPESIDAAGQGPFIAYFSYEYGDAPSLWVQEHASGRRKRLDAPQVFEACAGELERFQAAPAEDRGRWLTTDWVAGGGGCKEALYRQVESALGR